MPILEQLRLYIFIILSDPDFVNNRYMFFGKLAVRSTWHAGKHARMHARQKRARRNERKYGQEGRRH